jgi:hypothetical protein
LSLCFGIDGTIHFGDVLRILGNRNLSQKCVGY